MPGCPGKPAATWTVTAEAPDKLPRAKGRARLGFLAAPPGVWEDHGLVFCRDNGRPLYPDYVSKRFRKLAAEAGVPVIKLHEGGRHTGNSLLYDAQVRPDIVKRRVGHTTDEMSQRYNHPEIEAHRDAAEQVRRLVRGHGMSTGVLVAFHSAHISRFCQPVNLTYGLVNLSGAPGARTLNPRIKSPLLCH
jgi:hypothetical protein